MAIGSQLLVILWCEGRAANCCEGGHLRRCGCFCFSLLGSSLGVLLCGFDPIHGDWGSIGFRLFAALHWLGSAVAELFCEHRFVSRGQLVTSRGCCLVGERPELSEPLRELVSVLLLLVLVALACLGCEELIEGTRGRINDLL